MKIALAQTNPTIGDIAANTAELRDAINRAGDLGADLVVFPELAIIGYPPKDLLLKPAVIRRCAEAVEELASHCTGIAALIGYPRATGAPRGRPLHNAVAFCRDGRVESNAAKTLLPTYDVFDEHRYFEPAPPDQSSTVDLLGQRLGVSICEDMWNDHDLIPHRRYDDSPIDRLAAAGAQVHINCSASPFVVGKHEFRLRLLAAAAMRHGLPVLFCNQVGGNDELVFDGQSCAIDPTGQVIAHAKGFEPDLLIVDLPAAGGQRIESPLTGDASAYHALVLGLRDYCRKCGFKSLVLGLSGGIDSAVTAALSVAALGPDAVTGIAMPSQYSSPGSIDDAADLAKRLGIKLHQISIHDANQAFENALAPVFQGRAPDTTEENLQARIRGTLLMAISNKFGSLLVTTGNKSELAVGYCTLYGDMCGGLAVLSDVPKTMVWRLGNWINDSPDSPLRARYGGPVIPPSSITKAPSAELRPDQTDQDSLPPYELLDRIIELYVEHEHSIDQIAAEIHNTDPAVILRVVRMIDTNEYKRKQAAPGLKITGRAFGFGRRMPIAQGYRSDKP